jgi:hypothetical protein
VVGRNESAAATVQVRANGVLHHDHSSFHDLVRGDGPARFRFSDFNMFVSTTFRPSRYSQLACDYDNGGGINAVNLTDLNCSGPVPLRHDRSSAGIDLLADAVLAVPVS